MKFPEILNDYILRGNKQILNTSIPQNKIYNILAKIPAKQRSYSTILGQYHLPQSGPFYKFSIYIEYIGFIDLC